VTALPWLRIAFDELLLGVREVPGSASNPRIQEYHRTIGLNEGDDVAWCSSFVGWCLERAGFPSTEKPNARSYLNYGRVSGPELGAIAVLWRGSATSWQGHVGFVLAASGGAVTLLGGNQGDAVSVATYSAQRLLGCRWPTT
jgi:uncharacterized protein (TIGR02594 family)